MITLDIISFLEVAVNAYPIHHGQKERIYEEHAHSPAPNIPSIYAKYNWVYFFSLSKTLK